MAADPSPELAPRLAAVREALARPFAHPSEVAAALERLLLLLVSPAGRTDANCVAAADHLARREGWGEVDWSHLPGELGDVLDFLSDALRDAVAEPARAAERGGAPEELLARLRATGYLRTARG